MDATKQSRGILFTGCGINRASNNVKVGSLCWSSSITVSQLNCFTASIVSLKIELCASELMSFISDLIFMANSTITDLDVVGDFAIADESEVKLLRAKRLMFFFREGVVI